MPRRVQCLKYLVLASMLMESKVRRACSCVWAWGVWRCKQCAEMQGMESC